MPSAAIEDLSRGCDCHIHAIPHPIPGPTGRYAPEAATMAAHDAEALPLGITRKVLCQASQLKDDNAHVLSLLEADTENRLRGVAIFDRRPADPERMTRAGFRAVRILDNTRLGPSRLADLVEQAEWVVPLGWHVEVNTAMDRLEEVSRLRKSAPEGTRLCLDHLAYADPRDPDALAPLFRLMDEGDVWVQLSPTRVSHDQAVFADLGEIYGDVVTRYPDRCVWASDWPHVNTPKPRPLMEAMLERLAASVTSAQFRASVEDNAAALYGFD